MTLLAGLLAHAPDDPLMLAGAVLLAWLPLCALGLAVLELLALTQGYLAARAARSPRMVPIPPEALRPLVMRRISSGEPHSFGVLDFVRVIAAIGAVLALTTFLLAVTEPQLLALMHR